MKASSEGIGAWLASTWRSESTRTVLPLADPSPRRGEQILSRALPPGRPAAVHGEGHGDGGGGELPLGDVADGLQVGVAQHRRRDLQLLGLGGPLLEEVAARPETGRQGHHQLLADGVNGRVGDLGEELLEVGEEIETAVAEHCQRGIVAHRADGLLAVPRHRGDDHLQLLLGVPEDLVLHQQHAGVGIGGIVGTVQLVEPHGAAADPFGVWVEAAENALHGVVVEDGAVLGVDQEQAAGLQAPLLGNALLGDGQDAGLTGHDHPSVVGDQPARRPQPVAVEGRADGRPSVKAMAAGPSQGSSSEEWNS